MRKVKLDENFFTGYRRTILEPSEVLVDILVPFTEKVKVQMTKDANLVNIILYKKSCNYNLYLEIQFLNGIK